MPRKPITKKRKRPAPPKPAKPALKPSPGTKPHPPIGKLRDRTEGEVAFVREGRTLAEVALALDAAPAMVQRWYLDGGWEKKRQQYLLSSDGVCALLEQQLRLRLLRVQKMCDAGKDDLTGKDADTILKFAKAVRELRGDKASLMQTVAVLQDLILFLRGACPDLLPALEPHVESFLQAKRKAALANGG